MARAKPNTLPWICQATRDLLAKVQAGKHHEAPEGARLKALVQQGYVVRSYALTEQGRQVLERAPVARRRSLSAADFGLDGITSKWFGDRTEKAK